MFPSASGPKNASDAIPTLGAATSRIARLRQIAVAWWQRRQDADMISKLSPHEMERFLTDTWAERRAGRDVASSASRLR